MHLFFLSPQGNGELAAAVIKSLEDIKLDQRKSLEDIKLDQRKYYEKVEQDIKKLDQDKQAHVSKSYSEMGQNVLETLDGQKLLTIFGEEVGQSSIMTNDDVEAMASLDDEYESNCYVQCKLIPIFEEIGLSVVNSERPGFQWLQPLIGGVKSEKRPDLIICNPCFYEVRAKPDVGAGVLAVQNKLLGNENKETLLYGVKAGHPLRFLDDIHIVEGKKEKLSDSAVGQLKTYAGLQARKSNNPVVHRIALFDREKFILFLSKGGDFVTATQSHWNTPGNKRLLQEFFNVSSPLVKALKASCKALSVTLCTPQLNLPCILGAGGSGVVFRVTPVVADLTGKLGCTRSKTVVLASKALKVVLGDPVGITKEWETAKRARHLSNRVVNVGKIYVSEGENFGAYLMDEVGTAVETSSVDQRQKLFAGLHGLHVLGITHGDARVQNAISLPDGIMWIDFVSTFVGSDASALISKDFCLLFKSLFDQDPSAAQIDAYKQCISAKRIDTEVWEAPSAL